MAESNDKQAGETAGKTVYVPLIENQLKEEGSRKSSFEQRGIAVITTSGVLVSLLFGLAAVITKSTAFELPSISRVLLIIALVLFVLAAIGGLVSNWPLRYSQINIEDLERFVSKTEALWDGPSNIALQRLAEAQVGILKLARKLNLQKGQALLVAMIIQVLAVVALAAAVIFILIPTNS